MQPVASFSIKFSEKFFRKTAKTSSAGFPKQSSRKRNKVRPKDGGSSTPVYAGLQLYCAGVPAMLRLFFSQRAEESKRSLVKEMITVNIKSYQFFGEILVGNPGTSCSSKRLVEEILIDGGRKKDE